MLNKSVTFNIDNKKIANKKLAIVKSNFNEHISNKLLQESINVLEKYDIEYDVYNVPGAFEIPYYINKIQADYDGFIALGCLIRGKTLHFDIIASSVSNAILNLGLQLKKPIGFGVLTLLDEEQSIGRIKNAKHATLTTLQLLS